MENNIIQEFIKLLYNEPNNQRDFESIKVHLKYIFENENINEEQIIKIKNKLVVENIVDFNSLHGVLYITLKNIGFEIVQNHTNYGNYLNYIDKEKEIAFRKERFQKRMLLWTLIFTIIGVCVTVAISKLSK